LPSFAQRAKRSPVRVNRNAFSNLPAFMVFSPIAVTRCRAGKRAKTATILGRQSMSNILSMNLFDAAIYVCLFAAVVVGFMTGLLRSVATIFGYIAGMGVAVAATPRVTPLLATYLKMPAPQTWVVVVAIFVAAGVICGALLRLAVNEMVSPIISI